jgi:putative SbcD/Mre11-related phosphoesterase
MLVHKEWLLTPERALVHVVTATAIVADMHLGYCEARQRAGEAVPTAELDDTLSTFELLKSRHKILRVVVAGDLVENRAGLLVASRFHLCLRNMGIELTVVPGNHDRGLETLHLPVHKRVCVGGWHIVHGSGPLPGGRVIVGHYHPALRIDRRHVPCFLIGRRHMILPAFSLDAKGGPVISRCGGMNARVSRSGERDTSRFGGPGLPGPLSLRERVRVRGQRQRAHPFGHSEAAAWQAIAIVGNSLVAVRPKVNARSAPLGFFRRSLS